MAEQAPVALVKSQGHRTVDALNAFAAGAAGDETRETPAVEQDDGLFAILKARAECLDQPSGERRLLASVEELLAHIDQLDGGHGPLLNARGEFEQCILAALRVMAALQARRGRTEYDAGAGG